MFLRGFSSDGAVHQSVELVLRVVLRVILKILVSGSVIIMAICLMASSSYVLSQSCVEVNNYLNIQSRMKVSDQTGWLHLIWCWTNSESENDLQQAKNTAFQALWLSVFLNGRHIGSCSISLHLYYVNMNLTTLLTSKNMLRCLLSDWQKKCLLAV